MKTLGAKSRTSALFIFLMVASVAIWWTPLQTTFTLAFRDERYTHILLILPVSAALIFIDWKPDWPPPTEPSPMGKAIACAFLITAVFMNAILRWREFSTPDIKLAVSISALIIWWIGSFIVCFGPHTARRALFPLGFLFWIVPLPIFVLDHIVSLLQFGSAAASHLFFLAVRIPVEQRGMLIHIPGLTMEVAPECSSIRSSLMLVVTTMVLAHLLLRSTWKKILVVVLAIPLSVAKNGLRIFVLGVLATRVDPSFLTGRLHRDGGIIYFMMALGAIFLLLWILQRGDEKKRATVSAT